MSTLLGKQIFWSFSSIYVFFSVGADEEVSETERIRLLADYIQETECLDL
jgi:hypothetical protein